MKSNSMSTKWMGAALSAFMLLYGGMAQAAPSCTPTYSAVAADGNVTFTANCSGGADYAISGYKWAQAPADGVVFTDIAGATGSTYTTTTPAGLTKFKVVATALALVNNATSDVSGTVKYNSLPDCTVTATPATITLGSPTQLKAVCVDGVKYPGGLLWYAAGSPPNHLALFDDLTEVTLTPATTTTYYVDGINNNGDVLGSTSATVTVNAVAVPTALPSCLMQVYQGGALQSPGASIAAFTSTILNSNCANAGDASYAWGGNANGCSNAATCTVTSPVSGSATYSVTATVASVGASTTSATITVTPVDTTPAPFAFTDQTNVALSSTITSNTITVSGINAASPISITGGQYKINSGSYTSSPGNVNNNDTVTVQLTSSTSNSTATNATLTIGGISDIFTATTRAAQTGDLALCSSPSNTVVPLNNSDLVRNWTTYKTINILPNQSYSMPLVLSAGQSGRFTLTGSKGGTKNVSISTKRCDFSSAEVLNKSSCWRGGSSFPMEYDTATTGSKCHLIPGTTYYINIRNGAYSGYSPIVPTVETCTSNSVGACTATVL